MARTSARLSTALEQPGIRRDRTRLEAFLAYCRRNPPLVYGAAIIVLLILFSVLGPVFVNTKHAQPLSALPFLGPSATYPLGTDDNGRDLLAVMVVGLPVTLRIGFLAGAVGLLIGIVLGVIAGYLGGFIDAIVRTAVDILLTVPSLLILTTIAASIKGFISANILALVIASLAWRGPTRTVRAQVLTMRERGYILMARRSGAGMAEVLIRELLPNLLPFLAASFVSAVALAILSSIGLEALGLGPQNEPTLGMTIYWAIKFNAQLRGLWWWWLPPIGAVVLLLVGLTLFTMGLDELANPRLRRQA
jgi:peptide/nickel transport system permease protein